MTTIPADDLATIEHLDFAPPCELRTDACDGAAEWIVRVKVPHCGTSNVAPWCQSCLDEILGSTIVEPKSCPACSGVHVCSEASAVISFEPIGGKS